MVFEVLLKLKRIVYVVTDIVLILLSRSLLVFPIGPCLLLHQKMNTTVKVALCPINILCKVMSLYCIIIDFSVSPYQ